ncbi:nuclear transport factor 2 family protein [Actinomadura darangshiensis]|uniref:Nuclear transport factor 2 family protein n=1 Tax=Actinomadura darangshiensis TaxID=705336 RepID=A0A4R4ZWL1_9ACTN|nr:nuclear transport factor 2 family protein [Actinomadura darangshiensis]TDD63315.1 nuclear transport factor 2 family protein [Actinomadura darangshiensis]
MDAITWNAPDADHPARRAARASMTAVAEGRKDDWLDLFTPDALIEDPVGPSFLDPSGGGHRGRAGTEAFWTNFISTIAGFRFDIADSFANGPCCANVATITTTTHDGSTMTIDCVLIYTVDDAGRITSLRAHWEPDRAMATITKA